MTSIAWPNFLIEQCEDPWQRWLARSELDPLMFHAPDVVAWPPGAVERLERMEILRELPLDRALFCPECPESPLCDVDWREPSAGKEPTPWTCCPNCGFYELPRAALRRWAIDFAALQGWLAERLEIRGSVDELVPSRLWRLGKTHWGGRPTTVFCGRAVHRSDAVEVLSHVERSTSAVLLVPQETPHVACRHPIVPLTLVGHWDGTGITIDTEYANAQARSKPVSANPKRTPSGRLKVEQRLRRELETHLAAVADHVRTAFVAGREPTALPCPTRKELARRCRTSEATVCRCFADNHRLERLWETAQDPLAVLNLGESD